MRTRIRSLTAGTLFALATLAAATPAVLRAQASTVVVLVRHGEKEAHGGDDPELAPAGQERAKALAQVLGDAGVDGIIVTPFKRTRATAAPLAARLGIAPDVIPLVGEGGMSGYASMVADTIRSRFAGRTVLVVGHSNTLGPIIAALGGPRLADLCDNEYATLYTLIVPPIGAAHLIRSTYGAPDAPRTGNCARTMQRP